VITYAVTNIIIVVIGDKRDKHYHLTFEDMINATNLLLDIIFNLLDNQVVGSSNYYEFLLFSCESHFMVNLQRLFQSLTY
jgi:hypothetical protein